MTNESPNDPARRPLASGRLLRLVSGPLEVLIAPEAGGRIAQVIRDGHAWLVGPDDGYPAADSWGSFPMVPWSGRVRHGQFTFDGQRYQLPITLGDHAIHGFGFDRPWQVEDLGDTHCVLARELPQDNAWPFGGRAEQRIAVDDDGLHLVLSLTAGARAMPAPVLGWHPWFHKPDAVHFTPDAVYPRDAAGIAILPTRPPTPAPWDDCFINRAPVHVTLHGATLELTSDCDHWVVYDTPPHSTCVEPQTGPPDGFNLFPDARLEAGDTLTARFDWRWR
ncbi:MAG: aldose epimerase [Pseudoxanthomonas sp.]